MSEIELTIKCSNADKATVKIAISATVLELKEKIAIELNIPSGQQRLIYKGKVLKDDLTLDTYAVEDGHTVHMVKGVAPPGSASSTPSNASSTTTTTPPAGTLPTAYPAPSALNHFAPSQPGLQGHGGGGTNPFGAMGGMMPRGLAPPHGMPDMSAMQQQLMQNPDLLAQIMDSPMMQNVLNNPDTMRNMMAQNPQMQAMLDANPQIRHIMNDPAVSLTTVRITLFCFYFLLMHCLINVSLFRLFR